MRGVNGAASLLSRSTCICSAASFSFLLRSTSPKRSWIGTYS
jgi:hypothetical protein